MKPSEVSKRCSGCEQNFYNGNNPYGVKQCWNVPSAKIVRVKPLSIDQQNPQEHLKRVKWQWKPDCYQQKRMVFCKQDSRYITGG